MRTEYRFEVVFIRLTLIKTLKAEADLHLALLENYDSQNNNSISAEANSHTIKIRKIQKIIDLQKLAPFKFKKDQDSKLVQNTAIELSINDDAEKVEIKQLKTAQMISDLENNEKSIFEHKFEWSLGELEVKIYVIAKEVESLILNVFDPNLEKVSSFKSNSMSRTKRPPQLNISRKGALATSQARSSNSNLQISQKKAETEHLFEVVKEQNVITSPIQKKPVFPKYKELQTPSPLYSESISAFVVLKKKEKKIEQQNDHVKGLMESHHRQDEHDANASKLSLKLKAVIILLVIGFLFLVVDTLTDRSIKKLFKSPHPVQNEHPMKKDLGKRSKGKSKKAAKH